MHILCARVFLWGAKMDCCLPAFPLPTHDILEKHGQSAVMCLPLAWTTLLVGWDDAAANQVHILPQPLLSSALGDLPPVSHDTQDTQLGLEYAKPPSDDFQRQLRQIPPSGHPAKGEPMQVHDHVSCTLNKDDAERAALTPHCKGGCFRHWHGVIMEEDGTVALSSRAHGPLLSSGAQAVQERMLSMEKGKSCKPFGRVWWDEVNTPLKDLYFFVYLSISCV